MIGGVVMRASMRRGITTTNAARRRAISCVSTVNVQKRDFTGNTKVLDEKEKGDERIFFKRLEGKNQDLLRNYYRGEIEEDA